MKVVRAIFALLLLGACAPAEHMAPPPNAYRWGVTQDAQGNGYLAFAVDETDDQPITLTCTPGSGVVHVSLYLRDFHPPIAGAGPWPQHVVLASGATAGSYKGEVSYDGELYEAYYVGLDTRSADPVLTAFRESGWLASPAGAVTDYRAETDAERQAIKGFFKACEQA